MNWFEYVFTLFGLLLGFSLVEVLGGFAKALEARFRSPGGQSEPVRLGWLTPLMGLYVLLDVTSFWSAAWNARDTLAMNSLPMLGGLAFAGSYYLAAHAVFPSDPQPYEDLDSHYFQVRKWVFGILSALLVVQILYWLSVPELAKRVSDPLAFTFGLVIPLGLSIAPILVKGRVVSIVLLTIMIALYIEEFLGSPLLTALGMDV